MITAAQGLFRIAQHRIDRIMFGILLCVTLLMPAGELSFADNGSSTPTRLIHNNAIEYNGSQFWLYGVVVPGSALKCSNGVRSWPCGATATLRLHELLKHDSLNCEILEPHQNRHFARCNLAGRDIAGQLVLEGWALAAAGVDEYRAAERSARERSAGMWKDSFIPPNNWRLYPDVQLDLIEDLLCSTCALRRQ